MPAKGRHEAAVVRKCYRCLGKEADPGLGFFALVKSVILLITGGRFVRSMDGEAQTGLKGKEDMVFTLICNPNLALAISRARQGELLKQAEYIRPSKGDALVANG